MKQKVGLLFRNEKVLMAFTLGMYMLGCVIEASI